MARSGKARILNRTSDHTALHFLPLAHILSFSIALHEGQGGMLRLLKIGECKVWNCGDTTWDMLNRKRASLFYDLAL